MEMLVLECRQFLLYEKFVDDTHFWIYPECGETALDFLGRVRKQQEVMRKCKDTPLFAKQIGCEHALTVKSNSELFAGMTQRERVAAIEEMKDGLMLSAIVSKRDAVSIAEFCSWLRTIRGQTFREIAR